MYQKDFDYSSQLSETKKNVASLQAKLISKLCRPSDQVTRRGKDKSYEVALRIDS